MAEANIVRVNLSFDLDKPTHEKAYKLIQSMGRKKTDFITECCLNNVGLSLNAVKVALSEVLQEHSFTTAPTVPKEPDLDVLPDFVFEDLNKF